MVFLLKTLYFFHFFWNFARNEPAREITGNFKMENRWSPCKIKHMTERSEVEALAFFTAILDGDSSQNKKNNILNLLIALLFGGKVERDLF